MPREQVGFGVKVLGGENAAVLHISSGKKSRRIVM